MNIIMDIPDNLSCNVCYDTQKNRIWPFLFEVEDMSGTGYDSVRVCPDCAEYLGKLSGLIKRQVAKHFKEVERSGERPRG
jgi:hypothetical protein